MEIINNENRYPIKIDSHFTEIPSVNIHKEKKNDWLINIFTSPIEELPDTVKDWRNNLIHWLQNAEGNFIITTHFMVINVLISSSEIFAPTFK